MPDNSKRVESWELLTLASMPRADALELADRYAAQTREEQFKTLCNEKWEEWTAIGGKQRKPLRVKPFSGRELWNARCTSCKCETPVYLDSNLCPECDPRARALKL